MGTFSNSLYVFGGKDLIQQNYTANNAVEAKTGATYTIIRGKRQLDKSEPLEEIKSQWKRPATEEVVLRQFSNLNISNVDNINAYINDANMVSIEDLTDEESCDESTDYKCLIIPEALRQDYETFKTRGNLPDPTLMKLASYSVSDTAPGACLALVPYVPRPNLPLLPVIDTLTIEHKDDKEKICEVENGTKESADFEPMDFASEDFIPSKPLFPFNSGFTFGEADVPGQSKFVCEQTNRPDQPWQLRFSR